MVEFIWRLEIDGVSAVRHERERRRPDILLHQDPRQEARPILVAGQNQRRNGQTVHVLDQFE
jgi:hypothetical protein